MLEGFAGKVWNHEKGRAVVNGVDRANERIVKLAKIIKLQGDLIEKLVEGSKDAATKKQIKNFREETSNALGDILAEVQDDTV